MKLITSTLTGIVLLLCASFAAFSQVDIRVYDQGNYVSKDTMLIAIDANDNTGTGATNKIVYFNIYNLSPTNAEAFYLESDMPCSNSSTFYQFCQEYPPAYNTGTCHTFHRDGLRIYDDYDYLIAPDTCNYNYLRCHFFIYDYSVEQQHEKIYQFFVKRKNTHEVLDSMYMIIRRGNKPCATSQPVGIHTLSVDDVADIYPNPVRNYLTVAAKADQLTHCSLLSADGKMVFDTPVKDKENLSINTGKLSAGIYYLKVTDRKGASFFKKIVVDN